MKIERKQLRKELDKNIIEQGIYDDEIEDLEMTDSYWVLYEQVMMHEGWLI